jgi:hypothetical protein
LNEETLDQAEAETKSTTIAIANRSIAKPPAALKSFNAAALLGEGAVALAVGTRGEANADGDGAVERLRGTLMSTF